MTGARRATGRPHWPAALVAAGIAAVLALAPRPASAHATLTSSSPQPGQRLQTAPGVVVLTFSQPLNIQLSRASVVAPGGASTHQGSVSESEIRIPLSSGAPGVYEVRWTSVSAEDGHVLSGDFSFGVDVTPGAGPAEAPLPAGSDLALAAARGAEYGTLLLAAGLLLLRHLARRPPAVPWVRARVAVALAAAVVGGAAVVSGEAVLAAGGPSPNAAIAYLTSAPTGWARIARVAAEAAGLLVALRRPRLATGPLAAALVALAASGHAASVQPAGVSIAVTTVHLASAGLWAGGILALVLQRPPGGWRGRDGALLLARFTPVALVTFGLTVATGLLQAAGELTGPGDVAGTIYGQVLGLKALAVLLMVPLSFLAWRRLLPVARVEALLALVVIGASALLAAFPLPPARFEEASAAQAPPSSALALPADGTLTLASHAGDTLVGLTLRPGEPGRNTAWLYVLPLDGEQAAADLPVSVATGGRDAVVRHCGPACRTADLVLHGGGEKVRVGVGGSEGGVATLTVPPLPAPDAGALVAEMQRRMHALSTYRIDETISPPKHPLAVAYAYQAPDRVWFQVGHRAETVIAGHVRYERDAPEDPWREEPVPPVPVPDFIWDGPPVVAARVLGTTEENGQQLQGVSFFENDGGVPIWFELWVDGQGLVRRAEMMAQGHFMEHRYRDFDAPFGIRPPGPGVEPLSG